MQNFLLAATAACLLATPAIASFDLQITEIFPGQGGSNDLTEDWFEITNFGTSAWTAATDGGLWFDDVSGVVFEIDPGPPVVEEAQAVPLEGITSIAPGESVIFVEGGTEEVTAFEDVWSPVLATLPQVGFHAGSGLGGGGDAVTLFLDANNDGSLSADVGGFVAAPDVILDQEAYTAVPVLLDGSSFDVILGLFSSPGVAPVPVILPSGIPATPQVIVSLALGGDDFDTPVVGTPGFVPVPEPGTMALVSLGLLSGLMVRRK